MDDLPPETPGRPGDMTHGEQPANVTGSGPDTGPADPGGNMDTWLTKTLAIDFEAAPDGTLFHLGAVFNGRYFSEEGIRSPRETLKRLSAFGDGARYILGHNILRHDLALAEKILPEARILALRPIDTLFLSPLAFPENPYHKLVKDYKLVSASKNDPLADARLALSLFRDQAAAFYGLADREPGLISFFALAFEAAGPGFKGIYDLFCHVAGTPPAADRAKDLFLAFCRDRACMSAAEKIWETFTDAPEKRPVLAYLASWLRVAGGNSILPPWVRHEFPEVSDLIHQLRYACGKTDCSWCRRHSHPKTLLKNFFGYEDYRSLPDGRRLQQEIVRGALSGADHLAILPTGGGKSICYQIPALHRYERTGALTIVISPLKALMKDQVDNLNQRTGTEAAAAINGSLTLPERGVVMEKVRMGDVGLLYISPEQLRNISVARLIRSRQVDCWIFDEAHCLSKWGHDFRPDYLHVADTIRDQQARTGRIPVVGAFTATAKKDVVEEICGHFREKLDRELVRYMGGVDRTNLDFQVFPVTAAEKYDAVARIIRERLGESRGGAIVYCATRKGTEALSQFLNERGIPSQAFHAGRSEPDKRNIQDDFTAGSIPVICATNAFGMGIDKQDIRLVIHADIPGSLENYLQEAGRAGRDLDPSDCILLYEQEDIEHQFSLNAHSKLSLKDIQKILGILKKRGIKTPEIVITPGEIMRLIGYADFGENDGRARVGVAWLERRGFLKRSFNQTLFFKGTPLVATLDEAREKIGALRLSKMRERVYQTLLTTLFNAEKNALISADLLCEALSGIQDLPEEYLEPRTVMAVLSEMAKAGLIREGAVMTAFVRPKGKESAPKLLALFSGMETAMADLMAELSPESSPDTPDLINLRRVSQQLKDRGFEGAATDIADILLRTMAADKGETGQKSLKIAGRKGGEHQRIYVNVPWQTLKQRMARRHACAAVCLDTIIQNLPPQLRSGQAQVLARFFISDITQAMAGDLFLSGFKGDAGRLVESALLFLHDTKAITLQNGLGVFRQALTLTLEKDAARRRYTKGDYEPLSLHYDQKNVQVHVMEKYARLGLEKIKTALSFVRDYFKVSHDRFVSQYFPGQEEILATAMTATAYGHIIQSLENPVQEAVVASPSEKNLLVLAGPGSGKTRAIVHRCAWLIKAKSVNPESILVLCYNHRTMIELRHRIRALAGARAAPVTAMTFHGLAMRITGRSLMDAPGKGQAPPASGFDGFIDEAVAILEGQKKLPGVEGAREFLTARYRYILVDEYQDIDRRQYRFITALTGRLEADEEARIAIMAVGDDDQSIYKFRDANVKYIRRFQADYTAQTFFLTENYRCSHPVIETGNSLIRLNRNRMKTGQPCRINAKRRSLELPPEKLPPEALVNIVECEDLASQAVYTADRISALLARPGTRPEDIAVAARQGIDFPALVSLRMALAQNKIPFCYALKNSKGFPLFRIREIRDFLAFLEAHQNTSLVPPELKQRVLALYPDSQRPWVQRVAGILDDWCGITGDTEVSLARARSFALACLLEEKQARKIGTGVFMGTVHSVKGMEFPHVFILDHGWNTGDPEEERRLFYTGMTRAMDSLTLCRIRGTVNPHLAALAGHPFTRGMSAPQKTLKGFSEKTTVSILGLEDLYISFPARFPAGHPIHGCLADLQAGDKVTLAPSGSYIHIRNAGGVPVGALSQKGVSKWRNRLDRILHARVLGIITRCAGDEGESSGPEPKVQDWLLPVLEILHQR